MNTIGLQIRVNKPDKLIQFIYTTEKDIEPLSKNIYDEPFTNMQTSHDSISPTVQTSENQIVLTYNTTVSDYNTRLTLLYDFIEYLPLYIAYNVQVIFQNFVYTYSLNFYSLYNIILEYIHASMVEFKIINSKIYTDLPIRYGVVNRIIIDNSIVLGLHLRDSGVLSSIPTSIAKASTLFPLLQEERSLIIRNSIVAHIYDITNAPNPAISVPYDFTNETCKNVLDVLSSCINNNKVGIITMPDSDSLSVSAYNLFIDNSQVLLISSESSDEIRILKSGFHYSDTVSNPPTVSHENPNVLIPLLTEESALTNKAIQYVVKNLYTSAPKSFILKVVYDFSNWDYDTFKALLNIAKDVLSVFSKCVFNEGEFLDVKQIAQKYLRSKTTKISTRSSAHYIIFPKGFFTYNPEYLDTVIETVSPVKSYIYVYLQEEQLETINVPCGHVDFIFKDCNIGELRGIENIKLVAFNSNLNVVMNNAIVSTPEYCNCNSVKHKVKMTTVYADKDTEISFTIPSLNTVVYKLINDYNLEFVLLNKESDDNHKEFSEENLYEYIEDVLKTEAVNLIHLPSFILDTSFTVSSSSPPVNLPTDVPNDSPLEYRVIPFGDSSKSITCADSHVQSQSNDFYDDDDDDYVPF